MNSPLLSIVVPVYNEERCLDLFHARLSKALKALEVRREVVYVDDGSTDGTLRIIARLREGDPCVAAVSLSRNFGHQTALTAGMDFASGDAVVTLDGDLQHPPELIAELVARWRSGAKVVHAVRAETEDAGWLKSWSSRAFYGVVNRLSPTPIPRNAADFRLLDRQAVDLLKSMKEHHRFLRGMIGWLGLREDSIGFVAPPRAAGRSKYTWRKMARMAADGIVSFSILPLRAALWLGFFSIALNAAYAGYVLYMYFFHDVLIKGWASLVMVVMFIGSVQLILLGIIGEYIGRTYEQVKARPLYVVGTLLPARGRDGGAA